MGRRRTARLDVPVSVFLQPHHVNEPAAPDPHSLFSGTPRLPARMLTAPILRHDANRVRLPTRVAGHRACWVHARRAGVGAEGSGAAEARVQPGRATINSVPSRTTRARSTAHPPPAHERRPRPAATTPHRLQPVESMSVSTVITNMRWLRRTSTTCMPLALNIASARAHQDTPKPHLP